MSMPLVAGERRAPPLLAAAGALALAVMVLALLLAPEAAFRAWLVAWVFALGLPAGATMLILTHALTGGMWFRASMPLLRPLSALLPVAALAGLPLLLGLPHLYEWAGSADAAKHADVARIYLNPASYALRFVVILVLWSSIALVAALRGESLSALAGAAMMLVYGLTVTFAATDWLMSLDAKWASSAFPAFFAVMQVGSGVGVAALALRFGLAREATRDLAKLVVALVLGLTYLAFIQFLVMWSGNLPEDVIWYVHRAHGGPLAVFFASFVFGSLVPFVLMLRAAARERADLVSLAGLALLAGIFLQDVWIVAPLLSPLAIVLVPVALFAAVAGGIALLPVAAGRLVRREVAR